MASTRLAGGDVAGAGATAAEVLQQAQLPLDAQVEAWLLTATCELAEGRADQARKALDQSLRLASTEKAAMARHRGGTAPAPVPPTGSRAGRAARHLAALRSTEEIARTMFVSVNTVRTHVRGILRKLAASRRNEAIRRARELGLV